MSNIFEVRIQHCESGRIEYIIDWTTTKSTDGIRPAGRWRLRWGDQGHILIECLDQLFRSFISIGRASPVGSIIVYSIITDNHNIASILVNRHASNPAARVRQRLRRLPLPFPSYGKGQDAPGSREV